MDGKERDGKAPAPRDGGTVLLGRFEERRRIEAWKCLACGATVVRGGSMLPEFCSNCGRKVRRWHP